MKFKNKFLAFLSVSSILCTSLPVSAINIFSDSQGNKFVTSGQDSCTLSINTKDAPLTEEMFNNIALQAKKDGYQYILLCDSVLLNQDASKKLALNFLSVGFDNFYNAQSIILNDDSFQEKATVLDIKSIFIRKYL